MANAFNRYFRKNTGTTPESVVNVPTGTTMTIIGCTVSNTTGSTVLVDVFIRSGGIDYYLIRNAETPSGNSQIPIGGDQKVVLLAGDALFVRSSVASSVDVVLSTLNIT